MHNVTVAFAVLLVMLLSYFFGCFNGSFMVSHFIIRDDVRKHGSGNAGLTNFYRTYGAKYALLVIACDMGKTVAACLLGSFFFRCLGWDGTLGTLLAGLGCELGHIFPVFYGLRGGKGILSGGTLVLLLNWRVAAVAWALFLLLWLRRRTLRTRTVAKGPTWGCGFTAPNVRMQYTGESFSEGLQSIATSLTQNSGQGSPVGKGEIFPAAHSFDIGHRDRIGRLFAAWWVELLRVINQRVMRLRTGKINHYILFALAFLGLVFLLSVFNAI